MADCRIAVAGAAVECANRKNRRGGTMCSAAPVYGSVRTLALIDGARADVARHGLAGFLGDLLDRVLDPAGRP